MPTVERVRHTYWNPDGPIVSGKVFGVGWAPNFGGLTRMFAGEEFRVPDSGASDG